ncbi:MAG: ATP-binding cassette domain-containing protein [Bdellovibrionaceae bacterium]|nr:ATP-binding cassette domain-containing protein [Pseudobdellovibrionaceae bacterium]
MSVVKNLCKEFPDFSVNIPNWSLNDQAVTVLWGASGSGKTTIVRHLSGIEPQAQLEWMWGTENLANLPAHKRGLGVVLQHYGLFPHLTAEENIFFPIEAQKKNKADAMNVYKKWTQILNLTEALNRKASVLSGGEQQRVALARALITKPNYLILDEPFSALDLDLKSSARHLLKTVLQEGKIGALLVTHDREDVAALAQHVVILQKGRIIATQTAEEFLKPV